MNEESMGASAVADRAFVNGASDAVSAVPASIPCADDILPRIFTRAADLLEPEGAWTQGAFSRNADGSIDAGGKDGDPDGAAESPVCWCALVAVAYVYGHDLTQKGFPLTGPLNDASRALTVIVGEQIDEWNDHPDRKQEEVVAKLREAAKAIEARQGGNAFGGAVHESAVPAGHSPEPSGSLKETTDVD